MDISVTIVFLCEEVQKPFTILGGGVTQNARFVSNGFYYQTFHTIR